MSTINQFAAELTGRPIPDDAFVAYARNLHGEHLVFVQERNQPTGQLLHSDMGGDVCVVKDGKAAGIILDGNECLWLESVWLLSAWARGDETVSAEDAGRAYGKELRSQPGMEGLAKGGGTAAYRSAFTTAMFMAGAEATRRGYSPREVMPGMPSLTTLHFLEGVRDGLGGE